METEYLFVCIVSLDKQKETEKKWHNNISWHTELIGTQTENKEENF